MRNFDNARARNIVTFDCVRNFRPDLGLTLKRLGGGAFKAPLDISRDYSATRKALTATLYDFFLSSFPHILTPKIVTPGGTVLKLRNFLYMHVGPKMAPKCDFVYQINANWFFSHSSYKYAYFYSQWLKLICFSIIVLQKVSATNFVEKNNKNKRSKNKYIKQLDVICHADKLRWYALYFDMKIWPCSRHPIQIGPCSKQLKTRPIYTDLNGAN